MSKHILITNIGNRHLTFNGSLFQQLQNNEHDFTTLTKMCYDNHDRYVIGLSDILLPVLKQYENQISTVFLLGSDQTELKNAKTDQDTWWAAHLLKRELDQRNDFDTIVLKNNSFATDPDAQINFSLSIVRKLYNDYPGYKCILMDVGGTPQQKLALKQTCEFVWDEDKLIIINQNIQNKQTSIVTNEASRDLLRLEQIIHLLKEGQYMAAEYLTAELKQLKIPHLQSLIRFCHLRFIQLHADSCSGNLATKAILGEEFYEEFVRSYRSEKNSNTKLWDILSNQKISDQYARRISFEVSERYFLAQWHWLMQDCTSFVLSLQQFIETLINGIISAYTGYDIYKNYPAQSLLLINNLFKEYPETNKQLLEIWTEKLNPSLPVHITIAENLVVTKYPELQYFFDDLRDILKSLNKNKKMSGLDILRNAIAHEGKGVSNQALEKILPTNNEDPLSKWDELMHRWQNHFQYPEINVYSSLSNWLIDYIRRN